MQANILAVGDVVAPQGLAYLREKLPMLRKQYQAAFTVVNGENASNVGLTPQQAEDMLDAGADVITLGIAYCNQPGVDSALTGLYKQG